MFSIKVAEKQHYIHGNADLAYETNHGTIIYCPSTDGQTLSYTSNWHTIAHYKNTFVDVLSNKGFNMRMCSFGSMIIPIWIDAVRSIDLKFDVEGMVAEIDKYNEMVVTVEEGTPLYDYCMKIKDHSEFLKRMCAYADEQIYTYSSDYEESDTLGMCSRPPIVRTGRFSENKCYVVLTSDQYALFLQIDNDTEANIRDVKDSRQYIVPFVFQYLRNMSYTGYQIKSARNFHQH